MLREEEIFIIFNSGYIDLALAYTTPSPPKKKKNIILSPHLKMHVFPVFALTF